MTLTSRGEALLRLSAIAQWERDFHGPHRGSQLSLPPWPTGSPAFAPARDALRQEEKQQTCPAFASKKTSYSCTEILLLHWNQKLTVYHQLCRITLSFTSQICAWASVHASIPLFGVRDDEFASVHLKNNTVTAAVFTIVIMLGLNRQNYPYLWKFVKW